MPRELRPQVPAGLQVGELLQRARPVLGVERPQACGLVHEARVAVGERAGEGEGHQRLGGLVGGEAREGELEEAQHAARGKG